MIRAFLARPLWQQIVLAFFLGTSVGIVFGKNAAIVKPLGDIYLNLIRLMVVPLVFFSIVSSLMQFSKSKLAARLFARTIAWFIITSILAVIVGILFAHLIDPGLGLTNLPIGEYTQKSVPSFLDVVTNIFPSNAFKSMADGNILQVLCLSTLVGCALIVLGDNAKTIRNFIFEGSQIVFTITRWILKLTPIGTFGLIAWVVGYYGVTSLLPLGKFIFAMYAACLFHIVVVYGGLVKLHGLGVRQFFRHIFPAQQMAFVTSSSLATMPLTLRTAIDQLGIPNNFAQFSIPLAATTKMDGCGAIYPSIAAIFIAQYFMVPLDFSHYALIAITAVLGSLGTAGVPGTSIIMLTLTLSTAGLPLEGIGYIIAVDRVIDMMRTATNVTGQLVVTLLAAREENCLREDIYNGQMREPINLPTS